VKLNYVGVLDSSHNIDLVCQCQQVFAVLFEGVLTDLLDSAGNAIEEALCLVNGSAFEFPYCTYDFIVLKNLGLYSSGL
jgi:hypothetical protein